MKIERLKTAALVPYARNTRTHSDAQVAQIAASITEFGFTNPVLIDADGGIIAGHGRVLAAQRIGLDRVPCIRLSHLSEAQKRAYVIADNKIADNAGWDEELLRDEMAELEAIDLDLSLTGFDAGELDELFNEFTGAPSETVMDANAAPGLSEGEDDGMDDPDPSGSKPEPDPGDKKAPPIRVPILIELSSLENRKWLDIKKALGAKDNTAAFKHIAGIQAIGETP